MHTHVLGTPVDQGGSLYVRLEQVVNRVLLGQAAVQRNHRRLQNHMSVAQVGNDLVDADLT